MKQQRISIFKSLLCACFLIDLVYAQPTENLGRYDVIISEIMAKPSPEVGLPAVEYVELHNRLHEKCNLRNWILQVGNSSKKLPEIEIDSCGYVVIIAAKYLEDFNQICDNIYTLSSLSITDAGQSLTLLDNNNQVVHYVSFKKNWHSESIKQEGGWSLEMVDVSKPNSGKKNWDSSTDKSGGTPGRRNSIHGEIVDNQEPYIEGVTLLDSSTLRVHFNESVTITTLSKDSVFKVSAGLEILSISEVPPNFSSVDIHLSNKLADIEYYSVSATENIVDCAENSASENFEKNFGIDSEVNNNDLVINEIMTNSFDDTDADYLEIFNKSNKIIDLKNIKIGYGGDTIPKKAIIGESKGRQMFPNTYVVFCKDRDATLSQYICKDAAVLIQCDSLPNFASSQGIVFLSDKSLQTIDRLSYTNEMHYAKLLSTKGVALERININSSTQDENNWCSAAETAGFGTPGYENSQSRQEETEEDFDVMPEVFSPNNDGFDDFAEIICKFDNPENRITISIYNDRGFLIKKLVNNELCGTENNFKWDGLDDRNNVVSSGIYVVVMESWNLKTKKTKRRRKAVSVYR